MTRTFRELGVAPELCDELEKQGITHPFPIQEMTLPLALAGNDLIGQARTGTGKTLAFGLPLLQRLDPELRRTQALIVVPTRELCVQVHSDLRIGKALGISSVSVYGGVPYEEQTELLTSGAHVVVGTPGRLLDHLNRGILDLSQVSQLVLDEADEMLDMGFLPDVERLIESCSREGRHTMLFSATMPTEIVRLGRRYLDHPTFTRAASQEANTAPTVEQHFFQVHRMDKPRVLARILQSPKRKGVFVFVRTKHMADRLVDELEGLGTPAIAIHGDLRQTTRERNLDRFRSGKANVLVATEVAARGLDVTDVTHVINYDCPDDEKMYLHRIGRTARAGQDGAAITFAEHNEISRLDVIRKAVGSDEAVVDVFSTSDELTRRFDLPEETPWGHFVTTARAGGRQGSSSSRGRSSKDASRTRGGSSKEASAARPTRSRDDDTSTSDGSSDRPRGGSSRRGASAKDASTRGDRGRSGGRTTRDTSEAGSPPADDEKDASNEQVRARTRTRARATTPRESTRDTAPSRDGDGGGRTGAGRDDRQGEAGRERDASERQSSRTRGGSRRGSSSNRGQES
ncbi:MAG: DEAD/DEAH box helicase, partial [Nitriliruptoraceae bacterium]